MKTRTLTLALAGLTALCLASVRDGRAQSTDDRIDPSGPYRSKMRILEPGQARAPELTLTDPGVGEVGDGYSSALNQRAAGYLAARNGDTQAAIAALGKALATDALAPLAQQALREDLIALWASIEEDGALADAHSRWRAAGAAFGPDSSIRAARAYARLGRYEDALIAVNAALTGTGTPASSWQRLKIFALARLNRYAEAAALLAAQLPVASGSAEDWRNLIELQRAAGDNRAAVATAELAFESGVLSGQADTLRLARLYLATALPDHAAVLLGAQMDSEAIASSAENLGLLVRSQLQAGNDEAALAPSQALAELTRQPEDRLALARLQFDLGYARDAANTARSALRGDLGGARGRALMLLGESLLADGQTRAARRAFEDASEVGGVYRQAQAYLARLAQEEPETTEPAPGDSAVGGDTAAAAIATKTTDVAPDIDIKRIPRLRFFYLSEELGAAELPQRLRRMTQRVSTAVRRERLTAAGPLQWWVDASTLSEDGEFEVQLGVPVRTRVPPRGDFRNRDLPPIECAYRVYDGAPDGLARAWADFVTQLDAAGLTLGRDTRTVILNVDPAAGTVRFEMQIEVIDDA